jgi:hypothetical protein
MAGTHRADPEPGPVDDAPEIGATDAELGIGEEDEHDAALRAIAAAEPLPEAVQTLEALLDDPAIAPALRLLIDRRAAEMAGSGADAPAGDETQKLVKLLVAGIGQAMAEANQKLAQAINRSSDATVAQMPGYVKPIAQDELEARAAAYAECRALLVDQIKRFRAIRDEEGGDEAAEPLAPRYRLLEDAYEDATGTYQVAGTLIYCWRIPGTHMRGENDIARRLSALMWRYIGGEKQNSADVLAELLASRRGTLGAASLPEIGFLSERPGADLRMARVAGSEDAEIGPGNVHGTVVTVTKGGLGGAASRRVLDPPGA